MSRRRNANRCWIRLCAPLLLLAAGGCGSRPSETLPPVDQARTALDSALKAWCDGKKPGALPGTSPTVQVLDTPWGLGDRLASYEIVGADQSAAEMRFSVRLNLARPERVQEAQYYVLGRDPVMVFRDEDYVRNINMADGPRLGAPRTRAGRRGR